MLLATTVAVAGCTPSTPPPAATQKPTGGGTPAAGTAATPKPALGSPRQDLPGLWSARQDGRLEGLRPAVRRALQGQGSGLRNLERAQHLARMGQSEAGRQGVRRDAEDLPSGDQKDRSERDHRQR